MTGKNKKETKENLTMEDILASLGSNLQPLKKDQIVKGKVVEKNSNSLVLDIGGKSLGLVTEKAFLRQRILLDILRLEMK